MQNEEEGLPATVGILKSMQKDVAEIWAFVQSFPRCNEHYEGPGGQTGAPHGRDVASPEKICRDDRIPEGTRAHRPHHKHRRRAKIAPQFVNHPPQSTRTLDSDGCQKFRGKKKENRDFDAKKRIESTALFICPRNRRCVFLRA